MELDEDYILWFIKGTLFSQFDSIRSSYNAQKEQWTIEKMTTILAKEANNIKMGRARSVAMVTNQNNNDQKRMPLQKITNDNKPFKKHNTSNKANGQGALLVSNVPKNEGFKGNTITAKSLGTRRQIA
ncbi:uncharacterized protein LOC111366434 [Olea europaea var. sylvestris]|uniref:uncharacterized protein LOC111366434 n=1 Tax=Olea europaea var. sylvestris TaxID=158386 RepID=UPI000C1CD537|nr:uncharacterized protein LOC111366434 [Olea europaea var. sylvestris]